MDPTQRIARHAPAEHGEPTLEDGNHEAAFVERGFTVVPLFDPSEAAEIRQEISSLAAGAASANHSTIYLSFFEEDARRRTSLQQAVAKRLDPVLKRWVAGGRIQNHNVVTKAPGAGTLALHHHASITDCFFQREMNCWCALSDVDAETGAMRFVPRSHHILPYIRLPRGADYFAGFADAIENYGVTLPLKAGEAVLFDNSILHGSSPNLQDRTRLAISCQMVPAGARNGLCLEGDPGWIDFVEAPSAAAFDAFVQTGIRSGDWPCTRRIRNRNRPIREAEFRTLLASPRKASESVDPLDYVRGGDSLRARGRAVLAGIMGAVRGRL